MTSSVKIQNLPVIGTIAVGDTFPGERTPGTTGLITYTPRTMTGTAGTITVTNGNQVSGNPTFTIDSAYVGQTSLITTGTITTGTWNATAITVTYGGTGRASATAYAPIFGGTTSTGAHQSGTAGTSGQLLQSGGASAVSGWTTATYPVTASTLNKRLKSDGTNLIMSTTTMPDSGTSGKFILGDGTNYVESTSTIPTSSGATANKVLLSDGTNYALSTPTFPNASATTRKIIVSDGTNWTASTETYAVPSTVGKVMQSDGTNWTSATPTGTGTPVLATSPTLVTPLLGTPTSGNLSNCTGISLASASGVLPVANGGTNASGAGITAFNNITGYTAAGSTGTTSTNLVFSTSPTLITPVLGAATATSVAFSPTTGGIIGTGTNDNAGAGKVGEVISSAVTTQAISNGVTTNITSISLTAGDWDVQGTVLTAPAGTTTQSSFAAAINTVSATFPTYYTQISYAVAAGTAIGVAAPYVRLSLSGTTTVYILAIVNYAVSTLTIGASLSARRAR